MVRYELGNSIRVWLWCRTDKSLVELQKMLKDGRLRDILANIFQIFVKVKEQLTVKLSATLEQFKLVQNIF